MVRQLTQEAFDAIMEKPELYGDVSEILGVRLISLPKVVQRTPDRLSHYDVVVRVSKYLRKDPNDILEEVPVDVQSESKVPA